MADRSVVYRLVAQGVDKFSGELKNAASSARKLGDELTGAEKRGKQWREGLTDLGNTAGKVGLVAAAGLGAAVMKAADFDAAMSNVQAATHETADNMEDLRQAALDAGAQTVFSATEAAAGIEELAKAGVSTASILDGGLAGALDLAAAGELDVAEAAETAASAMTQFRLEGSQVPHIADLLAAAAGKAQGSVHDMGMALNQSGLVASQVGLSIEEATGALGAFASAGLTGSDAGTSLKTMLLNLTPISKKASDQMAAIGLSAYDAEGNFVGLTEYAGRLRESLSEMSDQQRTAALKTMFGNDAIRAANVLYEQGADGIEDWIGKVNDQGYAAETASIKLDNLKGDVEELGGALETALIGTGDGSQGMLRGLTQGATDLVNAYNKLPGPAKTATAGILGVTAVAGGGLWAFSKMVTGISDTRAAMGKLGMSADGAKGKLKGFVSFLGGPWGLALIGAGVALNAYMDQQAKTEGYVDSLTAALDDQTGAMTRQAMATNLNEEGWLEYAESIGVSADTVIDAALGSAEAMDRVRAAADAARGSAWNPLNAENFTNDSEQLIANIEAQVEAQKQAQKEHRLSAEAVGEVGAAAAGAAGPMGDLAGASQDMGAAASLSAEEIKAQEEALKDARDAATKTATAFFNLGDSLNDSEVSLGQWIAEMAESAAALEQFQANAQRAAKRGLRDGLIAALRDAGPEGAMRMKQLANATDAEIKKANGAWQRGEKAIDNYVDATAKVPPMKATTITTPGLSEAQQRVANLAAQIARMTDRKIIYVDTIHRTIKPGQIGMHADGGHITGPGTATSDSIPAYLSNGEYVIKAAAVQKYGTAMFDGLNAMRFADGGKVDGKGGGKIGAGAFMPDMSGFKNLEQAIRRLGKSVDRQSEMLSEAEQARDAVLSKMSDVASATISHFNTGLFDKSAADPAWAAGGRGSSGGPLSNLRGDIATGQERESLQQQLSALGLDGEAMAALLKEGSNADISGMIARGEIGEYKELYGQRAALQERVGSAAGEMAYGDALAQSNVHLSSIEKELRDMKRDLRGFENAKEQRDRAKEAAADRRSERNAEKVGAVVNGAASKGHRDKKGRGR